MILTRIGEGFGTQQIFLIPGEKDMFCSCHQKVQALPISPEIEWFFGVLR
jgi:hypothetical protein